MQVDDRLAAGFAASGAVIAVALAAMEGANTFVVIASAVMGALLALVLLVPIGLLVSPITEKQEPEHELVITDWRDLQVGDEIEVFNFKCPEIESRRKQELMSGPCIVMRVDGENVLIELKKNLPTKGPHWNATGIDACDFKFIRRP